MYRVRAVYDYASPHADDLDFKTGQVIAVTEEEGDDWYVGHYTDDAGITHDGLFPRNFVERLEPEPPPRPNRASRHQPLDPPYASEAPEKPALSPAAPPPPLDVASAAQAVPLSMSPLSPPPPTLAAALPPALAQAPSPPQQQDTTKPVPATKKPPPPIAAKSNAFRDRIAAFNAPAAAPIQPFKPSAAPANFVKKPFVAPPPSRNAYIPPVRDTPPPIRTYRREEELETADRQARDHDATDKTELMAHEPPNEPPAEADVQDQPKVSLKERIALLQRQQQEQAERAAAIQKEKPKRPPVKKRTESFDAHPDDNEVPSLERVASGASKERASTDLARPPRASHDLKSPGELLSDANDADQSGAGDTEDAGGESTSVEDDEDRAKGLQPSLPIRAAAAPAQELDVGDQQDLEPEEEEDDEMDAETRRKLELRERMAKMSGGMGMPGMFGGIPMGGLPPKKKKSTTDSRRVEEEEEHAVPQQRVAMFAVPSVPPAKNTAQEEKQAPIEKEDETPHPMTGAHEADQVLDVDNVASQPIQQAPSHERPPPVPIESKSIVSRTPIEPTTRQTIDCYQLSSPETVYKTYVACDGFSEYVMTVSVSSTFWRSVFSFLYTTYTALY